ncbi:MAG: N-acetylmuramoyl-L-alanine amidase [Holophaga sp.]|nr:N-acetylmuramoyl-L-alanine amidase [Holophaga sp.]
MILLFSLLAWSQTPKPIPEAAARLKVAVDPGHGGEDGGAVGPKGLREKDAALKIGENLKVALEAAGFDVLMIRTEDVLVPLWDRARLANEAGADLFISLHLNAARAKSAKGSEVYFLSLDQGDRDGAEVAAMENGGEGVAPAPDSVLSSILQDLAQKAYLQESERLAVSIQGQLNRLGGIKERGVKQAPFVVLRGAAMPAVLVEVAFISNRQEEAKLRDASFQKKAAEAMAMGVRRFFGATPSTARRRAAEQTK